MTEPAVTRKALFDALIEHGVLDEQDAHEFSYGPNGDERPPLGRILIHEGVLSVGQVMDVVGRQVDHPELRIGELAVQQGYCTAEDIERCLEIQRDLLAHPMEELLGRRDVDPAALVRALSSYIGALESALGSAALHALAPV